MLFWKEKNLKSAGCNRILAPTRFRSCAAWRIDPWQRVCWEYINIINMIIKNIPAMSYNADNKPSMSTKFTEGLTFIKRNGGVVLLRTGYQYTKKRVNKNGWSFWRCVNVQRYKCNGSLQIMVCYQKNRFQ